MSDQPEALPGAATSLSGRGARGVALAGLVGAVSGLAVQALVPRVLTDADTASFVIFWSLLFAVLGITGGIQNETTRAVRSGLQPTADRAGRGARVVPVGIALGAVIAAVVLLTAPVWAGHVLQNYTAPGVLLVAFAAVAFSGHASVTGTLAGTGGWGMYARVVGLESVVRMVLVGAVLLVGATLFGLMAASALATAAWLLALASSATVRQTFAARADRPVRGYLSGLGHAILASSSTAALVVGYPVMIQLTTDDAVVDASAPLLMAISLTRAPLLIPLNAFQGVAITHFVENPEKRGRTLGKIVLIVGAVGVVGAGLAALVGPWLLRVVTTYEVGPGMLAGLTGAGALLALLTLTGTAVLAVKRHRAYSAGWAVASLVSVLVLLLPWELEQRVLVSLWLGPLVGVAIHSAALVRRRSPRSVG